MSAPTTYRTLPPPYQHTEHHIPNYINNVQANNIPSLLRPTNYSVPYNPTVGSNRSQPQPQQDYQTVTLSQEQNMVYEQLINQFTYFSPDYIFHLFV